MATLAIPFDFLRYQQMHQKLANTARFRRMPGMRSRARWKPPSSWELAGRYTASCYLYDIQHYDNTAASGKLVLKFGLLYVKKLLAMTRLRVISHQNKCK